MTVIRYPGQGSELAEQQARELAASLSQLSGQQWTIRRVVDHAAVPTRGNEFAVKDALDNTAAWGDGNVWVYGDSTLGALEHYAGNPSDGLWSPGGGRLGTSNITRTNFTAPLNVTAFNTTRPEEQLHTVGHALEDAAQRSDPAGLWQYSGRPEHFPLIINAVLPGAQVPPAVSGHGTIHVAPGSSTPYDYSGDGYHQRTGQPPPWGGTEDGYYHWWLGEAPRSWWTAYAGADSETSAVPASAPHLSASPTTAQMPTALAPAATPAAPSGTGVQPLPVASP